MNIKKNNCYILIEDFDCIDRIDKFLTNTLSEFTRNYIQKLFQEKYIFIIDNTNKLKNINKNYKVKKFEKIFIKIPKKENTNKIIFEKNLLNILYEDEHLIILNKNKGIVVHQTSSYYNNTLVDMLKCHYKDNLSTIDITRPGIVHRLDKDTSGLLVIAKNNLVHNNLVSLIQQHKIKRIYEAIIVGNLINKEGIIDKPIIRCNVNRKKMMVSSIGKSSITFYKQIKEYMNFSHVEFQLQSGRTHQIRVHMASINNPLLGDLVYGNSPINKKFSKLFGQCLHAKEIIFNHPITKEILHIKSTLPEYFLNTLNNI